LKLWRQPSPGRTSPENCATVAAHRVFVPTPFWHSAWSAIRTAVGPALSNLEVCLSISPASCPPASLAADYDLWTLSRGAVESQIARTAAARFRPAETGVPIETKPSAEASAFAADLERRIPKTAAYKLATVSFVRSGSVTIRKTLWISAAAVSCSCSSPALNSRAFCSRAAPRASGMMRCVSHRAPSARTGAATAGREHPAGASPGALACPSRFGGVRLLIALRSSRPCRRRRISM